MKAIRRLAAALDGRLDEAPDWTELLATATRAWLGPSLYLALERAGALAEVPEEERDFLAFLHARNRERNRRLHAQLVEAGAALNRVGVNPILLKGAAVLATAPAESCGARMTSDLDLAISPGEMERARQAMERLGYEPGPSEREWLRPSDVGMLEFHPRPSERSAGYLSGDLRGQCCPVAVGLADFLLPSATARALHLLVHDMLKEGDYWRLRLDLRHVVDIVGLARSDEGVDWAALAGAMDDPVARRALEVQRVALDELFGVATGSRPPGWRARALHRARLAAAGQGVARGLVRAVGNLRWGLHRLGNGYRWRGAGDLARRSWAVMAAGPRGARL